VLDIVRGVVLIYAKGRRLLDYIRIFSQKLLSPKLTDCMILDYNHERCFI